MRTREEIEKEIDRLKNQIFMENMADFMDHDLVRRLENKVRELKDELKQIK